MKNIKIKLNRTEYKRFYGYVKNMMSIIKPFIFRGEDDGKFYCINHGLQDGTLAGGYTMATIREYAEKHSNITDNDILNLISCYGGAIKEKHPSVEIAINDSIYPVFIGADRELCSNIDGGYAIFGVPESDADIEKILVELRQAGIDVPVSYLKANVL